MYEVRSLGSANAGDAAEAGRLFAGMSRLLATRTDQRRVCILSGGEPTVNLSDRRDTNDTAALESSVARGGRNQELVLAALAAHRDLADWKNIVLLSGGTDGEDGPTDAAGAIADEALIERIAARGLDPHSYLARHDSYTFFDAVDGLLKTGPTHTNVMDLRVGLSVALLFQMLWRCGSSTFLYSGRWSPA